MAFGTRLRELREAAGLSQPDLADKAGIPVDSIQNWEQGRTKPRLDAIGKLARALGAGVDRLIAVEEDEATTPRPRGRPKKAEDPAATPKKPRGKARKEK